MSSSREVGLLVIERSRKFTVSLVSCVALSFILSWIVSMQCCMFVGDVSEES